MQRLEVSGAVRPIHGSLDVKRLRGIHRYRRYGKQARYKIYKQKKNRMRA